MVQQVETKTNEAILVGDQYTLDLATLDALDQPQETVALKVHAAADFLDPLIDGDRAGQTILLHRLDL
jgi:hypothetical protein